MQRILKHSIFWFIMVFWTSTIYINKGDYGWHFVKFNLVRLPLIMTATYLVLYYFIPKFIFEKRQYLTFGVTFSALFIVTTLLDRWLIGSTLIHEILKDTGLTYQFFNEIPLIRNAFLLLSIIGLAASIRLFNFFQQQENIDTLLAVLPTNQSIKTELKEVEFSQITDKKMEEEFLVKSGSITHKLNWKEILFLEKDENYVIYHTKHKRVLQRTTLSHLTPNLPSYFCRVHRSFMVSLKQIDQIEKGFIIVKKRKIPIGRTFKAQFLERVNILEI